MLGAATASATVNTARNIQPDNLTPGYTVTLPDTFRETREFEGQRDFARRSTSRSRTTPGWTRSPGCGTRVSRDGRSGTTPNCGSPLVAWTALDAIIKAGETKNLTFDVWFDNGYTAKQVAAQGNTINLSTALNVDFRVESTPVG